MHFSPYGHPDRMNSSMFGDYYPKFPNIPFSIERPGFKNKIIEQLQNKIKLNFNDRPSICGTSLSYYVSNGIPLFTLDEISYPYSRLNSIEIGGITIRL